MSIVGLEHEYIVRRGATMVDFRTLLHALSVPGRRLDPGDPHAYRLRSGAALTCDCAEAEIATPPVDVTAGFVTAVDEWDRDSTAQLQRALGSGYSLEGVSTHMSVEVPDNSTTAVAALSRGISRRRLRGGDGMSIAARSASISTNTGAVRA